jgi:hypothetical protein
MTTGAGYQIERLAFLWQHNVLVGQFSKPLAPIRGDEKVIQENQLLVRSICNHVTKTLIIASLARSTGRDALFYLPSSK